MSRMSEEHYNLLTNFGRALLRIEQMRALIDQARPQLSRAMVDDLSDALSLIEGSVNSAASRTVGLPEAREMRDDMHADTL